MTQSPYTYTEVSLALKSAPLKVVLPRDINKVIKKQHLNGSDVSTSNNFSVLHNETRIAKFFQPIYDDSQVIYSFKIAKSSDAETADVLTFNAIPINDCEILNLQSYSFLLPSNVLPDCISVKENYGGSNIIIDMILDINIMLTLNLPKQIFYNEAMLTMNNFYTWCTYSMPYSFDQRTPLLFKTFDESRAVISTTDGGLLWLERKTVDSEYSVTPLTSTSYLSNIKSKLFFRSSSDSAANIEFNNQTVSANSFIDIVKHGDLLIAISVQKTITIWSIEARTTLTQIQLNTYLPESYHSAVLSPSYPNSIFKFSADLLSVMLYLDNTYVFTFKLTGDNSLDLVSELTPTDCNQNWIPIDYSMVKRNTFTQFWFSWVFGDSCLYQSCKMYADSNNTVEWSSIVDSVKFHEIENSSFINKVNIFNESQTLNTYALRFIQSQYSIETINIALSIFHDSNNSEGKSAIVKYKTIEENIKELIVNNVVSIDGLKTEWIRFASVCQDIHNKTANKIFALVDLHELSAKDPLMVVLKGDNSLSVLKQSTTFELLYFNNIKKSNIPEEKFKYSNDADLTELIKLIDLILEYSAGYNDEVSTKIYNSITDNFNNNEPIQTLMTSIFDKYIINIANETVVGELLARLSSIESASDLMNFLSVLLVTNYTEYKSLSLFKLTNFNKELILQSIIFNNVIARKIIFGLMLIMTTLDISKPIERIFKKLYDSIKLIELIEDISRINDCRDIIFNYLTSLDYGLNVEGESINFYLIDILEKLSSEKFIEYLEFELLNKNRPDIALEFVKYLCKSSARGVFFQGMISLELGEPEESKNIFMENSKKIVKSSEDENKPVSFENIYDISSSIFVSSEVDYFFNLSLLFESKKYYKQSLEFALESSKCFNNEDVTIEKENTIFYKIFELSLNLSQYTMSFTAIKDMSHKNREIPLRKFIYKLFQDNKLGHVIEFNYGEDLDIVDELIYNMGEESLQNSETLGDFKLALKYYRVCHSLRLKEGDFRGAIETLYRFNDVVKGKSTKNNYLHDSEITKILKDNYLIMLNLMHSLQDVEDRWIIGKNVGTDGGDKVIDGEELEEEYIRFTERGNGKKEDKYLM